MIIDDYRGIRLPTSFCETIDNLLTRFKVPDDAKRLVFNFRDPTYFAILIPQVIPEQSSILKKSRYYFWSITS